MTDPSTAPRQLHLAESNPAHRGRRARRRRGHPDEVRAGRRCCTVSPDDRCSSTSSPRAGRSTPNARSSSSATGRDEVAGPPRSNRAAGDDRSCRTSSTAPGTRCGCALEALPAEAGGHDRRAARRYAPAATGEPARAPGRAPSRRRPATMLTSVVDDPTGYGRVIRARRAGGAGRRAQGRDRGRARGQRDRHRRLRLRRDGAARCAAAAYRPTTPRARSTCPTSSAILVADGRRVPAVRTPAERDRRVSTTGSSSPRRTAPTTPGCSMPHMRGGRHRRRPGDDLGRRRRAARAGRHAAARRSTCTAPRSSADGATIGPDVTLTDTTVGAGSRVLPRRRDRRPDRRRVRRSARSPTCGRAPTLADGVQDRHVRRGQGQRDRHRHARCRTCPTSATPRSASTPTSARPPSSSTTTASASTASIIGDHARTGADNMFVAPVDVGDGAYTAAGSVITEDVPPGALAVGRARQRNVAGWVAKRRPGTAADDAARRAATPPNDRRHRPAHSAGSTDAAEPADRDRPRGLT